MKAVPRMIDELCTDAAQMTDDAGDGRAICCLPDVVPPCDPGPLSCAMVGAALVQSAP